MIVNEEVKVVKQQLKDVICDCCGKSCMTEYGAEYMTMSTRWGFMSNKDLETWSAQICEKCIDEKFGFVNFKKETYIPFS